MSKFYLYLISSYFYLVIPFNLEAQKQRPRQLGIEIGVMRTGTHNAITDVPGVRVGHTTLIEGDHIRTGITAIIPHSMKMCFCKKCQQQFMWAMVLAN
jgi:D-aminopeptidase